MHELLPPDIDLHQVAAEESPRYQFPNKSGASVILAGSRR